MDHAAVVAGLMSGDLAFFFEDKQAAVWISVKQFPANRQSDNSGAHNSDVKSFLQAEFVSDVAHHSGLRPCGQVTLQPFTPVGKQIQ